MGSIFKGIEKLGPAGLVLEAILVSLLGILLLVGFIVLRRWYRARYFHKRNQHTDALRSQWDDILCGKIPAKNWVLMRSIATSSNPFCSIASRCRRLTSYLRCSIVSASAD